MQTLRDSVFQSVKMASVVTTPVSVTLPAAADFESAIDRLIAGLEKKRVMSTKERRIVAYHESGHAIVATVLPGLDPVHKISIVQRGFGALGYTIQRPTEDRYLMTREELEAKMAVLLGGRAAEETIFGHISTGAADDLSKVTDIARSMVTRYGMFPELGPLAYETEPNGFLAGIPQGVGKLPTQQYQIDPAFERTGAPGTVVLVGIFLACFALYYFVNWQALSFLWKVG